MQTLTDAVLRSQSAVEVFYYFLLSLRELNVVRSQSNVKLIVITFYK